MPEKKLNDTSCFAEHAKRNLCCLKKSCRLWIASPEDLNCVNLAALEHGQHTHEEIGRKLGVTRARISQVEIGLKKVLAQRLSEHQ